MRTLVTRLNARLADEGGFAMAIALGILALTLTLAAVATTVAADTNSISNHDSRTKAAFEAADAGLRAAVYRLNAEKPPSNQCPTSPTFATVDSSGVCPKDGPETTLGNGASFSYWISRVMQSGDTCAGPAISSPASAVAQRCITSVGTANGQTVRLQERVAAYTSSPVFPTAIFGTKAVTLNNNSTVNSDTTGIHGVIGTNGVLTIGGANTQIDGYSIPASATLSGSGFTNLGPAVANAPVYPIPTPVNPGTSSQNTQSPFDTPTTYQGGTCAVSSSQVQTNCDYRISRGVTYSNCKSGLTPVADCDVIQGNLNKVSWDPAGRTLYLGNNVSLTLGGGVYNFCSLYLSNGASISLAPGTKASIFIDSPSDPNSGAPSNPPAGSATNAPCSTSNSSQGVAPGTLTLNNGAWLNTGGIALNLQMYVYGDTTNKPPTNAVTLSNVSTSAYELYAPFSNVSMSPSNNTTFRGAIVGYTVTMGNVSHFTYEADSSTLQSGSLEIYYRTFFEQCPGQAFNPATPTAGC